MTISILSAVHNEEQYIVEMIESVQAQSDSNWELIFVPDGCSDNTTTLIEEQARKDSRIKLDSNRHKIGKVAAFNKAFEQSAGNIIILLAGDDTLPANSLAVRRSSIDKTSGDAVCYFKLRTQSESSKHDGKVLPKGDASSHSGGTITLSRSLAQKIFPIDPSLVSEDLWLTRSAEAIAHTVSESTDVVLNYRIHPGNSNPRNQNFKTMSEKMALRHQAWTRLLETQQFSIPNDTRRELTHLAVMERLRHQGKVFALLKYCEAPFLDRAAYISMCNPIAFAIRKQFFAALSGIRGR